MSKDDKRSERGQPTSGKVKHDDRGNAVWHWATDTARIAIASTTQLLRKLDVSGLSLESESKGRDEPELPQAPESAARSAAPSAVPGPSDLPLELEGTPADGRGKPGSLKIDTRGRGFDPYSSNAGSAKRAAAASAEVTRRPAAAAPRRSWWQRLLRRD